MKLYSAFYDKHVEAGGKQLGFAEFGEPENLWQIPAVYTTEEDEYWLVRNGVGFCDSSFIVVHSIVGKDAVKYCQRTFVNDMNKIYPGKILYSPVTNENGQVIRECSLFWIEENHVLFITGANLGNFLQKQVGNLNVSIVRDYYHMLALQGPKARDMLQKAVDVKDMPYMGVKVDKIKGVPTVIGRFGCTGELGYELYVPPEFGPEFWDILMDIGKEFGCRPFGMNCGFPLYVDAGYLLDFEYSKEGGFGMYEGCTPLEVGLGWTIAWNKKEDFLGKKALLKRKEEGIKSKIMGFDLVDPNTDAGLGEKIIKDGKVIGGTLLFAIPSPYVKTKIGKAWINVEDAKEGTMVEIEHEGKRVAARLAKGKWYDPESKRRKA